MQLYTKRKHNDYERIVDIYINDSTNEIPFIEDDSTFKLLIVHSGNVTLRCNNIQVKKKAPFMVLLSNRINVQDESPAKFKATTIFFKPTVLNDALTYEDIFAGKFNDLYGSTVFQDYILIRQFCDNEDLAPVCITLTKESHNALREIIFKMKYELNEQYDGFWPCRSRSYFMELLFLVSNNDSRRDLTDLDQTELVNAVSDYLTRHISDKLTLEILTKHFHVNRNTLNQAFLEQTGLTCLNHLARLRMDLAKLWLKDTEIPVSEIATRLGYSDQNYFARVFRKECGVTPTSYRYK